MRTITVCSDCLVRTERTVEGVAADDACHDCGRSFVEGQKRYVVAPKGAGAGMAPKGSTSAHRAGAPLKLTGPESWPKLTATLQSASGKPFTDAELEGLFQQAHDGGLEITLIADVGEKALARPAVLTLHPYPFKAAIATKVTHVEAGGPIIVPGLSGPISVPDDEMRRIRDRARGVCDITVGCTNGLHNKATVPCQVQAIATREQWDELHELIAPHECRHSCVLFPREAQTIHHGAYLAEALLDQKPIKLPPEAKSWGPAEGSFATSDFNYHEKK